MLKVWMKPYTNRTLVTPHPTWIPANFNLDNLSKPGSLDKGLKCTYIHFCLAKLAGEHVLQHLLDRETLPNDVRMLFSNYLQPERQLLYAVFLFIFSRAHASRAW